MKLTGDEAIADRAARWLMAERERKVRQREKRLAWLMAFKAGVRKQLTAANHFDEARQVLIAETDEARAALDLAVAAHDTYLKAAGHARSLRGALTRSVRVFEPVPNAKVECAYAELCALELQQIAASEAA